LTPRHTVRLAADEGAELLHQPALANPWLAHDGDKLRRGLRNHPPIGALQYGQLGVTANERGGRRTGVGARAASRCLHPPDREGRSLALEVHGAEWLIVKHLSSRPPGRLTDHDPAHWGNCLQAGGGVHHIAGDHALPGLRPSAQCDNRLAGADADPHGQPEGSVGNVQVLDGLKYALFCGHRPLGVVFVGDGCTEHGHDGITNELLHGPAQAFDLAPQVGVIGTKPSDHVLRICTIRAGGEANQIAEQHGDNLALVALTGPGGADWGTAAAAERKPP